MWRVKITKSSFDKKWSFPKYVLAVIPNKHLSASSCGGPSPPPPSSTVITLTAAAAAGLRTTSTFLFCFLQKKSLIFLHRQLCAVLSLPGYRQKPIDAIFDCCVFVKNTDPWLWKADMCKKNWPDLCSFRRWWSGGGRGREFPLRRRLHHRDQRVEWPTQLRARGRRQPAIPRHHQICSTHQKGYLR